ncbi:MAG: hypothetical protein FWD12_09470 [Alphaproteobacteria bacterium]|nr:hypothetical protein [Alphaproteobacteria bacterium]
MHLHSAAMTKRRFERAAAYEDTSADFVLANAVAAAERVNDSRERITPFGEGLGSLL